MDLDKLTGWAEESAPAHSGRLAAPSLLTNLRDLTMTTSKATMEKAETKPEDNGGEFVQLLFPIYRWREVRKARLLGVSQCDTCGASHQTQTHVTCTRRGFQPRDSLPAPHNPTTGLWMSIRMSHCSILEREPFSAFLSTDVAPHSQSCGGKGTWELIKVLARSPSKFLWLLIILG